MRLAPAPPASGATFVPRLRLGSSVWLDPDRPQIDVDASRLDTTLTTDVAIVGGGLTGAVVAHACIARGLSVAVLEAQRCGGGSTSANTGLLVYEPDEPLTTLARRYGLAAALRIWHLSRDATADLIDTLRDQRVPCDLAPRSSLYFSTTERAAAQLRHEYELRRTHGLGGRWLDGPALRTRAAVRGTAAIETRGHAQLDPYRACRGAARGGRTTRRPAVRAHARHSHRRHRARRARAYPGGSVRAGHVIVATGYATREFRPLAGSFALTHTYAMTTVPMTPADRARSAFPTCCCGAPPGRTTTCGGDRRASHRRWRRSSTGRRIGAGRGLRARDGGAWRANCARSARRCVGVPFERAWEGLFAVTPDGLPYLGPHPRYPRHLFALGYGGNGMAFACLAARLLVRAIEGRPDPDLELFSFARFSGARDGGRPPTPPRPKMALRRAPRGESVAISLQRPTRNWSG